MSNITSIIEMTTDMYNLTGKEDACLVVMLVSAMDRLVELGVNREWLLAELRE